ncbi:MAG TPA: CAP domain-containing protein [Devosiaceae bacterium]|jgi:uncharacterized protein YkwD
MIALRPLSLIATVLVVGTGLSACSLFGDSGSAGGLAPGLVARMDQPGANLDRAQALDIVNHYRATTGAAPLVADATLDSTAQSLASQYAATGTSPKTPPGARAIRVSAGYTNFAETFSGWRNSPEDAAVLADAGAHRAGVASVYSANSNYGVYWVMVFAD